MTCWWCLETHTQEKKWLHFSFSSHSYFPASQNLSQHIFLHPSKLFEPFFEDPVSIATRVGCVCVCVCASACVSSSTCCILGCSSPAPSSASGFRGQRPPPETQCGCFVVCFSGIVWAVCSIRLIACRKVWSRLHTWFTHTDTNTHTHHL